MNIRIIKSNLRREYKTIRSSQANRNNKLIFAQVLIALEELFPINNKQVSIGIYWPIDSEVDLRPLKFIEKFSLALPASIDSKNMNYHLWSENSLQKDLHGIPSPLSNPVLNPQSLDLLLVPALAVDQNGYRLGYGGGYFDRLRSNPDWKKIKALLVIPEVCISSTQLPKNDWDIPFDGWISEKGFHKVKR